MTASYRVPGATATAGRWRGIPTLAGTVDSCDAVLGAPRPTLIDPAVRDAHRRLLAWFPAALSRWLILEFRLAAAMPAVDVALHIDHDGAMLLTGRAGGAAVRRWVDRVRGTAAWDRVFALCEGWLDGRLAAIDHLWLEFDVAASAPSADTTAVPIPGVFVCFGEVPAHDYDAQVRVDAACAALALLVEPRTITAVAARMARAVAALPSGAYVPSVGVMLQRDGAGPRPVRVCVTRCADAAALQWLEAQGWVGSPADRAALGRLLAGASDALAPARVGRGVPQATMMQVDVLPSGIGPRVSFEHTFDRAAQFARASRGDASGGRASGGRAFAERALLDGFVVAGHADAAKCDALVAWPGTALVALRDAVAPRRAARFVNYTKIVVEPGRSPEVKAYGVLATRRPPDVASAARVSPTPAGPGDSGRGD